MTRESAGARWTAPHLPPSSSTRPTSERDVRDRPGGTPSQRRICSNGCVRCAYSVRVRSLGYDESHVEEGVWDVAAALCYQAVPPVSPWKLTSLGVCSPMHWMDRLLDSYYINICDTSSKPFA